MLLSDDPMKSWHQPYHVVDPRRESVGRALCGTNLRDNATSWGIYVAQLGDRRQDRTIR